MGVVGAALASARDSTLDKAAALGTKATDAAIRTAFAVDRKLGVSDAAVVAGERLGVKDKAAALDERFALTQKYAAALSKVCALPMGSCVRNHDV